MTELKVGVTVFLLTHISKRWWHHTVYFCSLLALSYCIIWGIMIFRVFSHLKVKNKVQIQEVFVSLKISLWCVYVLSSSSTWAAAPCPLAHWCTAVVVSWLENSVLSMGTLKVLGLPTDPQLPVVLTMFELTGRETRTTHFKSPYVSKKQENRSTCSPNQTSC